MVHNCKYENPDASPPINNYNISCSGPASTPQFIVTVGAMAKVLIGVTGSVASIKLSELLDKLHASVSKVDVKVVATKNACHFLPALTCGPVLLDEDEWRLWRSRGDPVLHIEWADILLIAPLDANTLAKCANGICDNLVTNVIRAWDFSKPIIACPAMNTAMWDNPLTVTQLETLRNLGYTILPPQEKLLVCGDVGMGAMASTDDIVSAVTDAIGRQ
ncbi:Phosphopantothenoylcysteine decarboxylase [Paramicrosporidium saccamoebae]|uniref:Phosphopantothenoylcysteine decarboxylase n=1 Tax=Paramicrosporidium saccamoebae TaxID=1246581 RepID=A0A2H9TFS2_9FUNG|nr:Phosphopantothenoylcysteine decarboxylase [Paramicrosporidium saccamoebae]